VSAYGWTPESKVSYRCLQKKEPEELRGLFHVSEQRF
jgi:hypothetical protein